MKNISIKRIPVSIAIVMAIICLYAINGCKTSEAVASKSGAQLWGENCRRCHNPPSPSTYSEQQWITVGMHMQSRALLTDAERDKIVDFLKGANN